MTRVWFMTVVGTSLFTILSRMVLWPIHLSFRWVLGSLFLGIKWLGHECDQSLLPRARLRMCRAIPLHPTWLHCIVLREALRQLFLSPMDLFNNLIPSNGKGLICFVCDLDSLVNQQTKRVVPYNHWVWGQRMKQAGKQYGAGSKLGWLKMEMTCSYRMSVDFQWTTPYCIPEYSCGNFTCVRNQYCLFV